MKKILSCIVVFALMLFSFVGCSNKNEKTLDDGKLTVGYTIYSPMNYYDENNNFVGFDTELALEVGKLLDVEIEFVEINWDNKVMALDSYEKKASRIYAVNDSYSLGYKYLEAVLEEAKRKKRPVTVSYSHLDTARLDAVLFDDTGECFITADCSSKCSEYEFYKVVNFFLSHITNNRNNCISRSEYFF